MKHYKEGHENGIYWYLDWKGDSIIIHVEKEDCSKEFLEQEHKFQHRPLFGFDISDVADVNRKLDELINGLQRKET